MKHFPSVMRYFGIIGFVIGKYKNNNTNVVKSFHRTFIFRTP